LQNTKFLNSDKCTNVRNAVSLNIALCNLNVCACFKQQLDNQKYPKFAL